MIYSSIKFQIWLSHRSPNCPQRTVLCTLIIQGKVWAWSTETLLKNRSQIAESDPLGGYNVRLKDLNFL